MMDSAKVALELIRGAVSGAPEARSELAGVSSVSEAGIPPSSESDKEL
jgi:hypothetical protein